MKKFLLALVVLTAACGSLPTSGEYVFRGEAYHKDGKPELAVKEYDKAAKINPDNPDIYASRGAAYFYMKDYVSAANDFITVLEKDPSNISAYSALGSSLAALGKNEDALKFVSYALMANPANAEALMSRAGVYYNMENYPPALEDLDAVIKIRPCVDAYVLRAAVYEKAGRQDLMQKDIETIKAGGLPLHVNSLVTY